MTTLTLELRLLGRPQWRSSDGRLADLGRKDAALLALLALEGAQARDVLAGRLWPDAAPARARGSLRQRIKRLREATGHRLVMTGPSLSLAEGVSADVSGIGASSAERLLECGELLAGHDYTDTEWLDEWAGRQRARCRRDCADALAGHAAHCEEQGEIATALRLGEHLLALAPQLEHAWRRQMRLHYRRGDRSAAIETFERFEAQVCAQTGVAPDAETLELLATIERAGGDRPAARAVVPPCLVEPPLLVGREGEQAAMAAAWSSGRAFVLIGDAGMGKSRLLADLIATRQDAVFESGRPGDEHAPYALLARLIDRVLSRGVPVQDEAAQRELARILPRLGPAPRAATHEPTLWHAVETVLARAMAGGLAVLTVDDLHFADLASVESLRWLSASPALRELRFAFAARPIIDGPIAALLRAWLDESKRPDRIDLTLLSAADVGRLLRSLRLPELALPGLDEQLFLHAGGQPFYTLETLKAAVLQGPPAPGATLPKPSHVQTLLDRRLRDLPPRAFDLLRVAAVAGTEFTVERAARLLGCSPLDLAEPWKDLETANVLSGLGFAHDLMRDSALRLLPQPVRRALHAALAAVLAEDGSVAPSRVAAHWQEAGRWPEAAACWHRAGVAARYAGRLVEQEALFRQAADCHRRAGNRAGQFDALHAMLDGMLIREGPAAALKELAALDELTDTADQRLRVLLVQAEALADLQRHDESADAARRAVGLAGGYPALLGDALALHGIALAQSGRLDEAIAAEHRAAAAAREHGTPEQAFRAVRSLAFVLYAASRMDEAVRCQREAMHLAGVLGDQAEAGAAEGNLAAMLGVIGDVPASHEHALRARRHYERMGSTSNSTLGVMNLIVLGSAAAYLGRYTEALAGLREAVRLVGSETSATLRAKARIVLAGVWLTLGQSDLARDLVAESEAGTSPAIEMQRHLVLARADGMEGRPDSPHWQRLGRLADEHPAAPLVHSAWIEWSYQGEPKPVVERLRSARAECVALGLPGTARTLLLRETARLGEIDDPRAAEEAATHAATLQPFIGDGLSAKSYPPEGWLVLAGAFARVGLADAARECRRAGVAWIRGRALTLVPIEYRQAFLERNPFNRALLEE